MSLSLYEVLRLHRNDIVARFVGEIERKDLSPAGLSRSLLVDHIPRFLDEIIQELQRSSGVRYSQDADDVSRTARQHGEQRWSLGYDLESLAREYGVLRHAILESAKVAGAELSIDEFDVLAKCLSVGVAEAVTEYIRYRDEELAGQRSKLEFLTEAGQLLSSSLDYRSTMSQLTRLVVPRLADWCAVHIDGSSIDEIPIAHVDPAKAQLVRDIFKRFPLPKDSAYGYPQVVKTGEPQLVTDVDPALLEDAAQSPEHLRLLRELGTRSWLIVPLRVQRTMFGALTFALSDSGRNYAAADLALAGELARRAAVAIDNSRLYELSQTERAKVEAAARAKDEFVAMVSHELRTPLNAILGWTRLARSGTLPDSKREHALEVIERNAFAQSQLVSDLLDISRAITGKIRINPSQVDFANIVEMVIEGFRPAADAKSIELRAQFHATGTLIRADGDRLQQVVSNLLANAVKFTPKRGLVEVILRTLGSDLELVVSDSGEGIVPEFLPHVFESFRQADVTASRPHGGLGVGLSIAKHIVELHGGTIEVFSEGTGKGATFTVRLPISPVVSTTLGVTRVPATARGTTAVTPVRRVEQIRVLVVDDDADARELVGYVLESSGMITQYASSADEAVSSLVADPPDIVVSDIGMPGGDGYSLMRRIRTLPSATKSIPVIALTAFASSEDRTRALVAGFNVHLTKPVEPAVLVAAVADLAASTARSKS